MNSAQLERIRRELLVAYNRIWQTIRGDSEGDVRIRTVVEGVARAVDNASPTWLPAPIAASLQDELRTPAAVSDLLAVGNQGMVVLEEPVARTSLGASSPTRALPVNGVAWWPATVDDEGFVFDVDDPDILVVHVLSTVVGVRSPWPPSVWNESMLTDVGMFALPLRQELTPPSVDDDDLGPLFAVLLGFGAAVSDGRVIFESVGRPGACAARSVTVLAAA